MPREIQLPLLPGTPPIEYINKPRLPVDVDPVARLEAKRHWVSLEQTKRKINKLFEKDETLWCFQ